MNWLEFKTMVEAEGVKDDTEIWYIAVGAEAASLGDIKVGFATFSPNPIYIDGVP